MMLEVKNLKRVYKVKNGEPVYALNDVSVKFPETGLVFILGKSGSGKSTLLNIMGGLDKAYEGEIIINGKSSKQFSGSDMDSYRNTYLGFIFQEYNILSDFTIRENIALALQLQHKPVTNEAIDSILKQVDLEGFGKRKPNELSGGQKQRVAIARALVKEPKIIFGDEPTGALDSNTGRQVFETLKNLSKDKLVVIVSHDRDFAEHFGDRVIELRDGKIISDITKTTCEVEKPAEGISLIGDNIIRVEKDHTLTMDDLKIINDNLGNKDGDIFITADSHVNDAICEAGRIDKSGNREEFIQTNPDDIKVGSGNFDVIKSHFSMGHAFRMGAKSLKVKPFRLVMTIILSTVAFSLFGVSATLSMFSTKSALSSTIKNSGTKTLAINMNEKYTNAEGTAATKNGLNETRLKELTAVDSGLSYHVLKNETTTNIEAPFANNDYFHLRSFHGTMEINEESAKSLGLELYKGSYPSKDNEICISKYAFYTYQDLGIGANTNDPTYVKPEKVTEDSIIGTIINFSEFDEFGVYSTVSLKIVGILDTHYPSQYEKYRTSYDKLNLQSKDTTSLNALQNSINLHNIIYRYGTGSSTYNGNISINNGFTTDGKINMSIGYYPTHSNIVYFNSSKTSVEANEAVISFGAVLDISGDLSATTTDTTNPKTMDDLSATISNVTKEAATEYFKTNANSIYDKFKDDDIMKQLVSMIPTESQGKYTDFNSLPDDAKADFIMQYLTNYKKDSDVYSTYTNAIKTSVVSKFKAVNLSSVDVSVKGTTSASSDNSKEYKIVGVDFTGSSSARFLYVNSTEATSLKEKTKTSDYTTAFITYNDDSSLDSLLNYYVKKNEPFKLSNELAADGDYQITFVDATLAMVESTSRIIYILTHVFIYVGVAFAIFAILLFYSFISISITNKKREIGILRAVGAKRIDVFKIFYSEAFIIGAINFVLATVITFVLSMAINNSLMKELSLSFAIMSPNILVVLMIFGVAFGASIISSLIPVTLIANKKPIDAIHNK